MQTIKPSEYVKLTNSTAPSGFINGNLIFKNLIYGINDRHGEQE